MLKRKLSSADLFLIAVNLIPVWGVWFDGWNAREVFMVYCLETIVIGLFTVLKLAIAGLVIKKDVWNETNGNSSSMPAWFFMIFFVLHYGFFVAIQLSIFLSISGAEKQTGIANAWDFLVHFRRYLSANSLWLLGGLVASYGFITLKDFVLSGAFRTTSLGIIMFEPYGRIFVQQFTVIVGSLFLGIGAGKIFISLFACIKIFIDVVVNYRSIMELMAERQRKSISSKQ